MAGAGRDGHLLRLGAHRARLSAVRTVAPLPLPRPRLAGGAHAQGAQGVRGRQAAHGLQVSAGEQLLDRRLALPLRPHPQLPDRAPRGQAAQAAAGVRVLHAQASGAHAHPRARRPDARPHGHADPAVAGAHRPRHRSHHQPALQHHDRLLGHGDRSAHRRPRVRDQHRARPHVRSGRQRHGVPPGAPRGRRRPAALRPPARQEGRVGHRAEGRVRHRRRGAREDAGDPDAGGDAERTADPRGVRRQTASTAMAARPARQAFRRRSRTRPAQRRLSRSTTPRWTGSTTKTPSPTSGPWMRQPPAGSGSAPGAGDPTPGS